MRNSPTNADHSNVRFLPIPVISVVIASMTGPTAIGAVDKSLAIPQSAFRNAPLGVRKRSAFRRCTLHSEFSGKDRAHPNGIVRQAQAIPIPNYVITDTLDDSALEAMIATQSLAIERNNRRFPGRRVVGQ